MTFRIKMAPISKLASLTLLGVLGLTACGGGGGDPGTSNNSAAANRFSLNLVTRPSTSVFFGGNNTTAYISLTKNCTGAACGNVPLDSIVGRVINLTASNSSAVVFSPTTVITDSEGKAQVSISSTSRDVSGLIQITASSQLSGYTYTNNVALRVNDEVDRTISLADDKFFQVLDQTKDCSNYQTFIVNVKNPAGVIQDNSSVTLKEVSTDTDGTRLAEFGIKDLGLFSNLGRVWLLQVRPPALTCLESGTAQKVADVTFNVFPGDGSTPYQIGYSLKYNVKGATSGSASGS